MKYINQRDYPDIPYPTRVDMEGEEKAKGEKTTIFTSGCGLCCAIMVADRLLPNYEFTLEDAINLSYETKANHRIGTDFSRFIPAFTKKLGLDYERTDDPARLRFCLESGGAAIILVRGDRNGRVGVLSHIGHYVCAIGMERDGRIAILDPYLYEGKFEEEGREGKVELKNEVIALCDMQTIIDDSKAEYPSFHLFWRK